MPQIRKAVIPAAGLGSRFYPLTKAQPKEMLPILDKPIIHYVVEEAVKSGLDQIFIIVGAGKDAIINYFDSNTLDSRFDNGFDDLPDIYFVRQKELLGLANSISYAEKFIDSEPFAVLLGDTIYKSQSSDTVTSQLINSFGRWNSPIIAVEPVPRDKIRDYGIIAGNKIDEHTWNIDSMIEKPDPEDAPSNIGIAGSYILGPEIFEMINGLNSGKNGEYQLTDALSSLAGHERVIGYEFSGTRYDIGTKELWVKTFFEFARNDERFRELL